MTPQRFKDNYFLYKATNDFDLSNGTISFLLNIKLLPEFNDVVVEQNSKLKEVVHCNTCKDLSVKKRFCGDCLDVTEEQQQMAERKINSAKINAKFLALGMRCDFIREIKRIFPDAKHIASDIDCYL